MTRPLLMLLAVLAAASASAQPTRVPGSRAMLTPPPGYRAADAFAGFQHDGLEASLMVTEIAGAPLAEMIDGMTDQAFLGQGVDVAERRTVTVHNVESLLVRGSQRAYGTTFAKWVLVTGDADAVFLVAASIPHDQADAHGDALERAMRSLTWTDAAPMDLFEGLGFTLDLPAGLPDRQRVGATLLAADGIGAGLPPGRPVYIAGLGAAPILGDLDAAAARRLSQTAGLDAFAITDERPVIVDGLDGWETVGTGIDRDSGEPITIALVLLPTEAGYVIVQALVGSDRADAWLPQFRAITNSIRWQAP